MSEPVAMYLTETLAHEVAALITELAELRARVVELERRAEGLELAAESEMLRHRQRPTNCPGVDEDAVIH